MFRNVFFSLWFISSGAIVVFAQDNWTRKNDVGWHTTDGPEVRVGGISFSINDKGYAGTGYNGGSYLSDFWAYDPATDVWTQKADFGGGVRGYAVGFSIGGKGYSGTGYTYNFSVAKAYNDFWEYDPDQNTWTQKNNVGGTGRYLAAAFTINGKGYIGTGHPVSGFSIKDFWEYDPATDVWTQKTDFGGEARNGAVGFCIDGKGYLGTGRAGVLYTKDFWMYDPSNNSWQQKADLGGGIRTQAVGFAIGNKGYIGAGRGENFYKDFWQYDPTSNSWKKKTALPGEKRSGAVAFTIGNMAYVGTGELNYPPVNFTNDLWMYDHVQNTWTQKRDFGADSKYDAVSFSIVDKGYIATGYERTFPFYTKDLWEFDPANNTWSQKADFAGDARSAAFGFSIGQKGYLGGGYNDDFKFSDFWEYDPIANAWIPRASFAGGERRWSVAFSIDNKGYAGTGVASNQTKQDFWEYDVTTDSWTQKASFAGGSRESAVGFSIGNKGYLGTGRNGDTYYNDFWMYEPSSNTWTQKAPFEGDARSGAIGFAISDNGYIGTGNNETIFNDFWRYDPSDNSWSKQSDVGVAGRVKGVGFNIGNKGYVGTGFNVTSVNDFWEYTPGDCIPPDVPTISSTVSSVCIGNSVQLEVTSGNLNSAKYWQWYTIQCGDTPVDTGTLIEVAPEESATYYVRGKGGCVTTGACAAISISVNNLPKAKVTPAGTVQICEGDTTLLTANSGNNLSYQWKKDGVDIQGATTSAYNATTAGKYKVTVTKTNTGCTKTSKTTTINVTCKEIEKENELFVYPNPSSNYFNLNAAVLLPGSLIYLCNATGKVVEQMQVEGDQLRVGEEISAGIYFMKVFLTDGSTKVIKVVKVN